MKPEGSQERAVPLSVVLPAYDEAANIEAVVRSTLRALEAIAPGSEIVVVDDGSRDGTGAVLDRLADELPALRVARHGSNRGYGAALRSGFAAARGGHIAFMDSDGQFDPAELALLWERRGEAEIVTGYRRLRRDPPHRRLYAWLYGGLVRLVLGVAVRDLNCGMKLFDGDFLRRLPLASGGALINAEIYARARARGGTIREVALSHFPRREGRQTGGHPRVVLRMFRELWRLRRRLRP